MSSTATLAEFASELASRDLPKDVLHHGKRLVLDTLGCALGGSQTPLGDVAKRYVDAVGGTSEDATVATGGTATALMAASANGRMAGALDADDTFASAGQTSHHGAGAVAAALAIAERAGASGLDLLTAVIVGSEAGARFGVSVPAREVVAAPAKAAGWRVGGGPAGVLAAAISAARCLQADPGTMMHAIGIAGAHVDVPPLKWFEALEAPMVKSMDGGWNAATGVSAALLAQAGMTGHVGVLDGDTGLWRAMGYDAFDFDRFTAGLGDGWDLLGTSFKRYPCQYWMQPALTAFEQLVHDQDLRAVEIESVLLKANTRSSAARFRDQHPVGFVTCQFNFPHAAAMLAHRVPPGPRWYFPDAMSDASVVGFREKVEVEIDPRATAAAAADQLSDGVIHRLPGAAVVRARGTTFTAEVEAGLGAAYSDETMLGDRELEMKFRDMVEPLVASDPAWSERADRIVELVLDLDRVEDVRPLARALGGPAPS